MLQRTLLSLGWLFALLAPLASTAHAEDNPLAEALDQTLTPPNPFRCPPLTKGGQPMPLAMQKALQNRIDDTDFQLEGLEGNQRVLQAALLDKRVALYGTLTCNHKTDKWRRQRATIATVLHQTTQISKRYDAQLQRMQRCIYRHTLARLAKAPSLTKDERAMVRGLQQLQQQLSKGHNLAAVKVRYDGLFRNIYRHYWRQTQLKPQACQLLSQTYRSWASFYESDNRGNRTIPALSRRIPLYNSNGHNDSYRVWSWERQKGRIPPQGLTLMHLDTHPDMGGYKDRSPGHWSDQVLSLQGINRALALQQETRLRAFLIARIKTARGLSKARQAVLLADLKKTPVRALRRSLSQQIPRRVYNIATPVTAAAYAGLTKKLLLCMPPWSHRFEMSKIDPKTGRSKGISLQLIKERKDQHIYFGVPNTMAKDPFVDAAEMPSFTMYDPKKRVHQPLSRQINFHVTACTNEDPSLANPSEWNKLPTLASYFTPQREGKDGFILGFDLDVFATNGAEYDNHVVPRSYGRDRSLKTALLNVKTHKHSTKQKHTPPATPAPLVTASEYKRVKYRLHSVFKRLQTAKQQGYIPKLITIADSTSLTRIYRNGLHRGGVGGGDYVPPCLIFLINYHVKASLARLYRGRLYPSFQTLAGHKTPPARWRKSTRKPQKMRRIRPKSLPKG